jgi:ATP-dependent Lon protease
MNPNPIKSPAEGPFPLLPQRNGVLFPGLVATLAVGRRQSLELIRSLSRGDYLGVALQRDPSQEDPGIADLHPVGTWARLREGLVTPQGASIVLEGISRFTLTSLVQSQPFWVAHGHPAEDVGLDDPEIESLAQALREEVKVASSSSAGAEAFVVSLARASSHSELADRVASSIELEAEEAARLLGALDVRERIRLLLSFLAERRVVAELRGRIDSEVRDRLGQGQKEVLLREQMKAIKKELGEGDQDDDRALLRKRLDEAGLSEEARTVADRELERLATVPTQSPEHGMIRTYLDWIAALPWSATAPTTIDIDRVAEHLDADHYGLNDVKRRILEHLAVLQRSGNPRATLLCLVGPPGVGKTSLGQSIADALGRRYVRVALGGVRDEAEIRGHRRTYVGALPGRILHALKKAKVRNPVFLLDEIDKLGVGWSGSPEAALLEVLDPEQNSTFQDHYLEIPFDLSQVLFICTANSLDTLSPPLRDRLDVIELSGYTLEEKTEIAKRHLVPRALADHALPSDQISIPDESLRAIIRGYTREAGVRQLNREIARLCRVFTLDLARHPETDGTPIVLDPETVTRHLGRVKFFDEVAERTSVAGVATGLAWTPVGGDILFIETSRMPGNGKLEITGQLGDVMKESARAALSYVRSNARPLTVDPEFFEKHDLHIHVPAGAVPKDGPSAGVTMFTALTSLLTGRRVRSDTAMTGECTLRGKVLPVGGIKEKILAAHRAGLSRVILPRMNQRDLEDLPESARSSLEFILADDMRQVLEAALEPAILAERDDELPELPFETPHAGADSISPGPLVCA